MKQKQTSLRNPLAAMANVLDKMAEGETGLIRAQRRREARKTRERAAKEPNAGVDQRDVLDGITLAVYHIEAGVRPFADYTRVMIEDLGEWARPYLRSWYEAVRYYPGFNAEGMSSAAEIEETQKRAEKAPQMESVVESKEMSDESILVLAHKAREHWEEWLPKKTKRLKARGMFQIETQKAAVRAYELIRNMVRQGMTLEQAEEIVLPDEILLQPEEGAGISEELQAEHYAKEAEYQRQRQAELRQEEAWRREDEEEELMQKEARRRKDKEGEL